MRAILSVKSAELLAFEGASCPQVGPDSPSLGKLRRLEASGLAVMELVAPAFRLGGR